MRLPDFELHQPTTVADAVAIAQRHADDVDYLAGGTDLLPNYKNRLNPRGHVVSLAHIDELRAITPTTMGALVRLVELEGPSLVGDRHPVIRETVRAISSPPLRQSGTVGGNLLLDTRCFYFNQPEPWRASKDFCLKADGDKCMVVPGADICYATYSADLAAPLLALDATAHLAGPDGARAVPLRAFFQPDGIRRFDKAPGEILTRVELPDDAAALSGAYEKLRLRDSIDYPVLGVAAAVALGDGDTVRRLELAMTGLDVVPTHHAELTAPLIGQTFDDAAIDALAEALMMAARPKRNVPMSAAYRKRMVHVFARRALTRARAAARR